MHLIQRLLILMTIFAFFATTYAQYPGSGNALDFNGTSDFVVIPHSTDLSPTNAITLEAWINADSWGINHWEDVIISKDGWAFGEEGYTLRAGDNGRLSFNFGVLGLWQEVLTGPILQTDQWYHVAATFDGTVMKVYVNGVEEGSTNYTGTMAPSLYDLHIGRIAYTAGGTRDFDGEIDEVRIWNVALTDTSIREYMCQRVETHHPQYGGLVGYWRMDDTTGTTVPDASVNGLTGNIIGAPLKVISGAAIGDTSIFSYPAAPLLLVSSLGDSLEITDTTGNPDGIHLYLVNQAPNSLAGTVDYTLDTNHYWGAFMTGGTSPTYRPVHYYGSHPLTSVIDESFFDLLVRGNNSIASWDTLNATQDMGLNTLTKVVSMSQEYILAYTCPDTVTVSQTADTVLTSDVTGTSYQWVDCDNSYAPVPGETAQTFMATSNGNYAVVVTSGACMDTSACISVINTASVDDLEALNIGIYPNPNNGVFVLSLPGVLYGKITIYNTLGQTVYDQILTGNLESISLEGILAGTYFVKVQTALGAGYKRIIVQ